MPLYDDETTQDRLASNTGVNQAVKAALDKLSYFIKDTCGYRWEMITQIPHTVKGRLFKGTEMKHGHMQLNKTCLCLAGLARELQTLVDGDYEETVQWYR